MRTTNTDSTFGDVKGIGAVAWAFCPYPILVLFSLYCTWFLAWLSLGHVPHPIRDDPKYINWLVSSFHTATWLLMLGSYIALPLNAFLVLIEVAQRILHKQWNVVLLVAAPVLLWLCLIFMMVYDPGKIAYWFFD